MIMKTKVNNIQELTPELLKACSNNYVSELKRLIVNGADVNDEVILGYSALHRGCKYGHTDIVEILLKCGANFNKRTHFEEKTPLDEAFKYGRANIIEILIRYGVNVKARGKYRNSVFHQSIRSFSYGHVKSVKLLMDAGVDINVKNDGGITPLMYQSHSAYRDRNMIDLFIDLGADVNIKSKCGKTAMDYAVDEGHIDIIDLLDNKQLKNKQLFMQLDV